MNEFEKLNSRVKYYLLDYKDTHMDKVYEYFKTTRLRDLTRKQLYELFLIATALDLENFKLCDSQGWNLREGVFG